jgi:hypothetical protein
VKPVEVPKFGGLQINVDPQEVGTLGAVDCLNTLVDRDGTLRTRDGTEQFASTGANTSIIGMLEVLFNASPALFVVFQDASDQTGCALWDSTGSLLGVHTFSGSTAGYTAQAVQYGTNTNSFIYFSTNANDTLYWLETTGGVLTPGSSTGANAGAAIGKTQIDNRLLIVNGSTVRFSDAGDPTTFGALNFVSLDPGDGENIGDVVSWGNQQFVFKASKFFVFYGNSEDATGEPVFNYRPVVGQVGLGSINGAVATPEGVYFANEQGVWLTTGGQPRQVSEAISDLFAGSNLPYTSATVKNITLNAPFYARRLAVYGRLLLLFTTAGTLALDRDSGQWTAHDLPMLVATGFDGNRRLLFSDGTDSVMEMRPGLDDDDGTPIDARWRTGFVDPGSPGAESVVRELLVDGFGTVAVRVAVNDAVSLGASESLTLGTAPGVAQGRSRTAGNARGRNVSVELSGSAPWQVSRMVVNVAGSSASGKKSE